MQAISDPPHSDLLHHQRCELLMPPLCPSGLSLVKSLISLVHKIIDAQKYSLLQRRNLVVLSRHIKILLMLLEEVRDTASVLPPSVVLCFSQLHVVLQRVKLLSEDCAQSSIICLLMEHRKMSEFFQRITQEMATALEILPLALIDVPCEVREQVELVLLQQAKTAKLYVDAKEARLCAEVRFVMGQIENKETPEGSHLLEIFNSLGLHNAGDCQRELEKLEAEVDIHRIWNAAPAREEEERNFKVPLSDLVSFVRYCKCILYGATETFDKVFYATSNDADEEDPDMKIPDDFRCPISLELMIDPVIVATGQTYERAEITRWIDGSNRTCPKSGITLSHTALIPNNALRNVIWQWCVQHNVRLATPMASSAHTSCSSSLSTPTALEATKLTVKFLLQQLPSASLDTQRNIAGELRMLAKCSSDSRKLIRLAGAIPLLIPLLSAADARTREHAVTAMLNISIYAPNKAQIIDAGALDHLIRLLQRNAAGEVTVAARENAVAVLFSLSQVKEAAMEIGRKPEAIEGLLQMLKAGSPRGKQDAASALFNMAVKYQPSPPALVKAGAVEALISMLLSIEREGLEEAALALLAVLANCDEGRGAILALSASALPLLVNLLRASRPKSKENAAAILLCLCRYEGHLCVLAKVQSLYGILLPLLHSLLFHGTPRARRKAASLLRILLT